MERLKLLTHRFHDRQNTLRRQTPSNKYRYKSLRKWNREIRLLRLLPGSFDDEIKLHIFHAPLIKQRPARNIRLSLSDLQDTLPADWDVYYTVEGRYIFWNRVDRSTQWDHPDSRITRESYDSLDPFPNLEPAYEALSYTWGEEEATAHISVAPSKPSDRSGTLLMRPNLNTALKHLRRPDTDRVLWIDALCINQEDHKERSEQVKRMGKIFSLARRVVVWLGEATSGDSSERALNILAALGRQVELTLSNNLIEAPVSNDQRESDLWFSPMDDVENASLSGNRKWNVFDTDNQLPYGKKDYLAIQWLLERPWWDRLWIWQEIHLANSYTIIQCGTYSVFVRRGISLLAWRMNQDRSISLNRQHLERRAGLCQQHVGVGLPVLMNLTQRAQCSNPHDRIYALFGMMDPELVSLIKADYSLPFAELFKDVCFANAEYYKNLYFLESCNIEHEDEDIEKPSWVPNWSKPSTTEPFYSLYVSGFSGYESIQCHNGELTVYGVLCGTVEHVADPAPEEGDLKQVLRLWEELVRPGNGETDETWKEKFVRNLRCGYIQESFPGHPLPWLRECVEAYDNDDITVFVSPKVRGRSLFKTLEGEFGVCSPAAQAGDMIAVVIGFQCPFLLRPSTALEKQGISYKVVCPVYADYVVNSEPLLGSLPPGYQRHLHNDINGRDVLGFTIMETGDVVYDDPRLGPLPEDWEFDKEYSPGRKERRWYRNKITGHVTWEDPRLTPEELRKRQVPIQEIVLV